MKLFIKYTFIWGLVFLAGCVNASKENLLIGEWEQFDTGNEAKYTYFQLFPDLTGQFSTVREGSEPNIEKFKSSQVEYVDENIFEINFSGESSRAKLILSAYTIGVDGKNGVATGML